MTDDLTPPASSEAVDEESPETMLAGKRVALAGRLGSMNHRHAANVLRSFAAVVVDQDAPRIDWVVIGANESPLSQQELLRPEVRDAAGRGEVRIIQEADLWQRLGLVDNAKAPRQFYTPMMLAQLLNVSVAVIRRWHRRGVIKPVRTMHRLPYFDFSEVATARRLAQWIESGASPKSIEQRLVDLVEVLPDLQRPLDQLSILVEGKHVLLRVGEGLIEPGGQLRFDFASVDDVASDDDGDQGLVFSFDAAKAESFPGNFRQSVDEDELLAAAFRADDDDDLETAIDFGHAILARDGPRADIHFQIGEWLYRINQPVAARERFYAAIESEPEFVEARASLGIVLAELGQTELAVAAFRGVLELHPDYPDVHYHLAGELSNLDRDVEARPHWQRFLELAPRSPWAGEAREHLGED